MKNKWYFNDVYNDTQGIISAKSKLDMLYKLINLIIEEDKNSSIVDDIIKYLKDDGDITIIDLNVKEYE